MQLLASLPDDSPTRDIGTDKYRTADGSNNSIQFPNLGRAGSYYARTVKPEHVPTALPDANVLFDILLARQGEPKQHPSKISSLLFALAGIIIDDVFRTSDRDDNVVNTSSYLDLSPLYGSDQETQNSIRTFTDGKLKPDTFAEVRFLSRPPEFSALLLCFSRFHNSIAEQLALINERDLFSLPANAAEFDTSSYNSALAKRDNDLFQTARLVTNGLYINIVLNDYVRTILNLQRVETSWSLDPRVDVEKILGQKNIEKGSGNQVSVEFNLIYRWHSTISAKGERWLNDYMAKLYPNSNIEHLTTGEMRAGIRRLTAETPDDPSQRTFGGLQRNARGYYNDAEIVKILTEATEDVAASFGPRHIPIALRVVEVMGIEQARAWGVASLNEMRRFFGLAPHKTFMDINSDPDIAASLEALYGEVENVELYPGVVIEEPKIPMTPGSGLCAGFTTTRAILSDAVALVRGDRFYTVDYTPHHLTAFGYNEASNNRSIAGGGYSGNSMYAFYPFTVPFEMRAIQRSLGHEAEFDYNRPQIRPATKVITDYKTVVSILRDSTSYILPWNRAMRQLGHDSHALNSNGPRGIKQQKIVKHAIFSQKSSAEDFTRFIDMVTKEQIRKYTHKLHDVYDVDIIKHVAALSWTQFAARLFYIPLNNPNDSKATFDDKHLYENMVSIFRFIYLDRNPNTSSVIREPAIQANTELTKEVKDTCEALKCSSFAHGLLHRDDKNVKDGFMPRHGRELLQRLFESGKTVDDVSSLVALLAVDLAISGSFFCSQMIDLFLTEPYYSTNWPHIEKLANDSSPYASESLCVYVREALRLVPFAAPTLRISDTFPSISDWRYTQAIKKGDTLHLNIAAASRDPEKFSDPEAIKLDRSQASYLPFVDGLHGSLIRDIIIAGLAAQLRVFGRLEGLKRAPGTQGRLLKKNENGLVSFLSEAQHEWIPLPTSMKLHFDSLDSLLQPTSN
ncbi:heme peroxidase [Cucurbitaria berberidis CBS 394.84]|uniref:Heme peroxidase n=1 Tax=Cucurbitaria berberidis CBS 394.84 TaxID=1168544 RepID=A0A9P4GHF6_9PLEO|nr:heme peroxidase [Cucurbitaria berberidis CBS 394.84]KAF1845382.1 heme peroxidase [Cucurbitaria berberidis CBS 394.84]